MSNEQRVENIFFIAAQLIATALVFGGTDNLRSSLSLIATSLGTALNFLQFVLRFFERSQCALSSHGSFGDMRVLIEFRRQNFGGCT